MWTSVIIHQCTRNSYIQISTKDKINISINYTFHQNTVRTNNNSISLVFYIHKHTHTFICPVHLFVSLCLYLLLFSTVVANTMAAQRRLIRKSIVQTVKYTQHCRWKSKFTAYFTISGHDHTWFTEIFKVLLKVNFSRFTLHVSTM